MKIKDGWNEFERKVINKDAPEIQRKEMKRAFYAGAFSILKTVLLVGGNEVSEDRGCQILEDIHQECESFILEECRGYIRTH